MMVADEFYLMLAGSRPGEKCVLSFILLEVYLSVVAEAI